MIVPSSYSIKDLFPSMFSICNKVSVFSIVSSPLNMFNLSALSPPGLFARLYLANSSSPLCKDPLSFFLKAYFQPSDQGYIYDFKKSFFSNL
jgi:hypothetical protein